MSLFFPSIMNEKRWTYLALLSALMLAIYVTTGNHVTNSRTTQQNHTAQKSLADQLKSSSVEKNPPQASQVKVPTSLDVGARPAVGDEGDHLKVQSNQVPVQMDHVVPVASQSASNSNYDNSMIQDPEFKAANLLPPGKNIDIPLNTALPPSQGFVLPMLYFDMGPNNLFRLLRQGAITASRLSRTVVVPVFHRHPRMGDNAKNPFVLPIFDTNYTVDLVWAADDSIDTLTLNQKVHTTDMRTFQRECNGELDAMIRCGDIDSKREDGLKHFSRAANTPTKQTLRILNMNEIMTEDNELGKVDISQFKCLGIVYGKKCLPNQENWLKRYRDLAPFYLRPRTMRFIAEKFIERVLHNQPYLAVHWRYESDWLDMCKPERPQGARARNGAICKLVTGLEYDQNTRDVFINNIKAKMTAYGLQSVYLASPPNNIELIRLLNNAFPGNFYYMDNIMKFANETLFPGYLENNYIASFVEQEVCFRSKFFMGAPLSSWTQSVIVDRMVRDNNDQESALEVVTAGSAPPPAPGYPPLVFQFPEGDFKFNFKN